MVVEGLPDLFTVVLIGDVQLGMSFPTEMLLRIPEVKRSSARRMSSVFRRYPHTSRLNLVMRTR